MNFDLLKNPPIFYVDAYAFYYLDNLGKPISFFKNRAYRLKPKQLESLSINYRGLHSTVMIVGFGLAPTLLFRPTIWAASIGIMAFVLWLIWFTRKPHRDTCSQEKPFDLYLPRWQRCMLYFWTRSINIQATSGTYIKGMLGSLLFWFLCFVMIVDEGTSRLAAFCFTGVIVLFLLPFYLSFISSCVYRLFLSKRGWRCQPETQSDRG